MIKPGDLVRVVKQSRASSYRGDDAADQRKVIGMVLIVSKIHPLPYSTPRDFNEIELISPSRETEWNSWGNIILPEEDVELVYEG